MLDLQRVPLVGEATANALKKLGINTISKLVSLSEEECIALADRVKSISEKLAKDGYLKYRLVMAHRYAKAIKRRRPLILGRSSVVDGLFSYYKMKKILFFDLEYDPSKPFIFLIGAMETNGALTQFFIKNESEERETLAELENITAGKVLVCYAGKSADMPTLRKCYAKHRLKAPRLELIDLFYDILFTQNIRTQTIYLPVYNLDEKSVARYLGYTRPSNLKIKDGLDALIYFHRYLKERNARKKEEIKEQLLLYNYYDLEESRFILEKVFRLFSKM